MVINDQANEDRYDLSRSIVTKKNKQANML